VTLAVHEDYSMTSTIYKDARNPKRLASAPLTTCFIHAVLIIRLAVVAVLIVASSAVMGGRASSRILMKEKRIRKREGKWQIVRHYRLSTLEYILQVENAK
jgi:hypothetical protein